MPHGEGFNCKFMAKDILIWLRLLMNIYTGWNDVKVDFVYPRFPVYPLQMDSPQKYPMGPINFIM
jgi:hypothetical protein